MANVKIRPAIIKDALPLSLFAANRFIDTFGFNYDPDDLKEFIAQKYNQEVYTKHIENPKMQNILALGENDEIIGYSQAGPMTLPLDGAIEGAIELYRFYLSDAAKGTGLAKLLFDNVLEFAKAQRSPVLYLGVWSQNHRALAFYHKLGFEIVGKYLYQVGKTFDDERIMRLMIAE